MPSAPKKKGGGDFAVKIALGASSDMFHHVAHEKPEGNENIQRGQ